MGYWRTYLPNSVLDINLLWFPLPVWPLTRQETGRLKKEVSPKYFYLRNNEGHLKGFQRNLKHFLWFRPLPEPIRLQDLLNSTRSRTEKKINIFITHRIISAFSHWIKLITWYKTGRWISEDIRRQIWYPSSDFISTEGKRKNEQTFSLNFKLVKENQEASEG